MNASGVGIHEKFLASSHCMSDVQDQFQTRFSDCIERWIKLIRNHYQNFNSQLVLIKHTGASFAEIHEGCESIFFLAEFLELKSRKEVSILLLQQLTRLPKMVKTSQWDRNYSNYKTQNILL